MAASLHFKWIVLLIAVMSLSLYSSDPLERTTWKTKNLKAWLHSVSCFRAAATWPHTVPSTSFIAKFSTVGVKLHCYLLKMKSRPFYNSECKSHAALLFKSTSDKIWRFHSSWSSTSSSSATPSTRTIKKSVSDNATILQRKNWFLTLYHSPDVKCSTTEQQWGTNFLRVAGAFV